MELSDCVRPRITPCSDRPAFCVIMLVTVGRMIPVPDDATAAATSSSGTECVNPSATSPTNPQKESGSREICFSKRLHQAPNQPALQDDAKQAQERVNVSDLLRSERLAVPGVAPFGKQRESRS